MKEEVLAEISKKLSILIALQLQTRSDDSMQDNVISLSRFELSTGEIAEILGTTPGTVAVLKSRLKKNRKKTV